VRAGTRRPRRALAAIVGLALLTTACGGGGGGGASSPSGSAAASAAASEAGIPARGDADLVIWTDELKVGAVRRVVDTFAKDNGITVAVQVISKDLQAAFITANAAGNGPDVFTGAHDWIGNLVQNGAIEPLLLPPSLLQNYAPVAVKATTYQGKLYALPYGVEALTLYRNTAVAPDAPATLDEAFSTGRAAVASGRIQNAFLLPVGDNGDAYHMEPILTAAGGYLFGTTATGDYDPADLGLSKPGALAAAQRIGALGEKGDGVLRRSVSTDNNIALFAGGKAAYLVSGPWALNDVTKGGVKFAISPLPGFSGGKPAVPFAGAQGFYVASHSKNKAFAQEFVTNAMNTPEAMQTMYDGAKLPPSMTVVQEKVATADPNVKVFIDAANAGAPMPAIPAMSAVWEPLGKAYAAIVGGADPARTMASAAGTIAKAIAG
jgi:arabinogalactan oligomer/maltooligosaccharide transport system substrate-binding protein